MSEKTKTVLLETDTDAIHLARKLLRLSRYGALAVLDPKTGAPLASRVAVASDYDGAPVILVSSLAAHTGGLLADARCSLLLGEPGKGDAMAHARITIACTAHRIAKDDPRFTRIQWRFLSHNPKARLYADLADFSYFRLEPETASLNGGFGKAYALTSGELLTNGNALTEIAAAEPGAVTHMNDDHRDAIANYAAYFAKMTDKADWIMTGIDADGFNIADGTRMLRIAFIPSLREAHDMHKRLVAMAIEARKGLNAEVTF